MSRAKSVTLDSLLLDLFQKLRDAGMALTLEQYYLLRQAVDRGYGLGGWQDLRRVCRLLWVKPCANYDEKLFDSTFDRYVQQHHAKMPVKPDKSSVIKQPETTSPTTVPTQQPETTSPTTVPTQSPETTIPTTVPTQPPDTTTSTTVPIQPPETTTSTELSRNLPQIPPRRKPSTQKRGEVEVPVAIQTSPASTNFKDARDNFRLIPTDFPIQLQDVQIAWRLLRRAVQVGLDYELDIEATVYRIEREGIFSDAVMRPVRIRRAELLLLIDDSPAMLPFFPAFQPFIQAITEARITPAWIYRFTNYPDEYLYNWHHPSKAEPLTDLLPKLHRHRTIALILSDGGAATATYSQERIEGISKFLTALSPCIRQLIWLNPLPHSRWEQTSAWAINAILNGKMLTYNPANLRTTTREIPQQSMISTWQMYPHLESSPTTEKI